MIRLFISYYIDKVEARQKELDECLCKNLNNPLIDEIHMLLEYPVDEDITRHKKIQKVHVKSRPSFAVFFEYINSITRPEDVSILANSDIYFDDTLSLLGKYSDTNVLALCRYDIKKDKVVFMNSWDSQDTWVFKGKIREVPDSDFSLGKAGCLCGETKISYNRGKRDGGREIKIRKLYENFNGLNKNWDLNLKTRIQSYNEINGTIFYNKIIAVTHSGFKQTIQLSFDNGLSLILTRDHKVLMGDRSYKMAQDIKINDTVIAKGAMIPVSKGKKRKYSKRNVVYLKYHPFAENKTVRGHKYKRVMKYRLVYEANMNNMSYEEFLSILRNNEQLSSKLIFLPREMEVHHKDDNSLNDVLENLEVLTKEEHSRLHGRVENFNIEYVAILKVVNIENAGERRTYDIQVEAPNNNFAANSIIVHNCDNAIANRLYRSGYNVINPSRTIKTYHLHQVPVTNYNPNDKIPQPYKFLTPTA